MKQINKLLILIILLIFTTQVLSQTKLSDAEENFEFLWNLFDQNYAGFKQRNVNWDETYQYYRNKVNSKTSQEQLYEVFKEMLTPLNDSHITLFAKSLDMKFSSYQKSKIYTELSSIKDKRKAVHKMTKKTLSQLGFNKLKEIGPKFRGNKLFAYSNNGRVAYLRFHRCFGKYVFEMPFDGPFLDKSINKIFKSFENLDELIIDIRFNIGGNDTFAQKLVSKLIQDEILAYYKQKKLNKNSFGELQTIKIKPKKNSKHFKKIFLLTNDKTVSAADVLALILKQLPNVTIVGNNSNGSFSDILSKTLPNDWKINLSNEQYFSLDMKNYEGIGVPVDIYSPTTLKDVQELNDTAIKKIFELLDN